MKIYNSPLSHLPVSILTATKKENLMFHFGRWCFRVVAQCILLRLDERNHYVKDYFVWQRIPALTCCVPFHSVNFTAMASIVSSRNVKMSMILSGRCLPSMTLKNFCYFVFVFLFRIFVYLSEKMKEKIFALLHFTFYIFLFFFCHSIFVVFFFHSLSSIDVCQVFIVVVCERVKCRYEST